MATARPFEEWTDALDGTSVVPEQRSRPRERLPSESDGPPLTPGTQPAAARQALDRLSDAVILLDAKGRRVDANRAAERLLARRDGLSLAPEGLRAAEVATTVELRGLVARAAETDPPREGRPEGPLLLARRCGRSPLVAVVTPLGRRRSPSLDRRLDRRRERRAVVAVFVSDPDELEPPPEWLRRLYGLTPTEAEVAARLARGRGLKEVARELGVSFHTARKHLREIFGKTGTRRQAALVRLLLTGTVTLRTR